MVVEKANERRIEAARDWVAKRSYRGDDRDTRRLLNALVFSRVRHNDTYRRRQARWLDEQERERAEVEERAELEKRRGPLTHRPFERLAGAGS